MAHLRAVLQHHTREPVFSDSPPAGGGGFSRSGGGSPQSRWAEKIPPDIPSQSRRGSGKFPHRFRAPGHFLVEIAYAKGTWCLEAQNFSSAALKDQKAVQKSPNPSFPEIWGGISGKSPPVTRGRKKFHPRNSTPVTERIGEIPSQI